MQDIAWSTSHAHWLAASAHRLVLTGDSVNVNTRKEFRFQQCWSAVCYRFTTRILSLQVIPLETWQGPRSYSFSFPDPPLATWLSIISICWLSLTGFIAFPCRSSVSLPRPSPHQNIHSGSRKLINILPGVSDLVAWLAFRRNVPSLSLPTPLHTTNQFAYSSTNLPPQDGPLPCSTRSTTALVIRTSHSTQGYWYWAASVGRV